MSKVTKKAYKKKKLWGADEEELLCEMWEQRIAEMRGPRKNSHIFTEMSAEMQERGVYFTPTEIQVKINNLTARYRKEKSQIGCSGGSPSEWPLFYKINAILGQFKGSNVELLTEESIVEEFLAEEHLEEFGFDFMNYSTEDDSNSLIPESSETPAPDPPEFMSADSVASCSFSSEPGPLGVLGSGKKKKDSYQSSILKELQKANSSMEKQMKQDDDANERQQKVEENLLKVLTQLADDSRDFQKALLLTLNNKENMK